MHFVLLIKCQGEAAPQPGVGFPSQLCSFLHPSTSPKTHMLDGINTSSALLTKVKIYLLYVHILLKHIWYASINEHCFNSVLSAVYIYRAAIFHAYKCLGHRKIRYVMS